WGYVIVLHRPSAKYLAYSQSLRNGYQLLRYGRFIQSGANEELFGKALAAIRDKVILATKVGNAWQAGEDGWTWNPSKQHILKSVDASLRRLQTDYIDLYQLHGGTIEDNFEEIVETFERLKDAGKIREYGLSSIRPNVFLKYIQHAEPVSN